jgi:hypothetical protein
MYTTNLLLSLKTAFRFILCRSELPLIEKSLGFIGMWKYCVWGRVWCWLHLYKFVSSIENLS